MAGPRVAFLIERRNAYQTLAPIIDEALRQGWEVACWHDVSHPTRGVKGYLYPSLEAVPAFRHGAPAARPFHGAEELGRWLADDRVEAVVSLQHRGKWLSGPAGATEPRWIGIQHVADFFQNTGPEGLLAYDGAAVYSDWWVSWAVAYFRGLGRLADPEAFAAQLAARMTVTGRPMLDQRPQIDPVAVRRRWGIPAAQPVVVFSPLTGRAGPPAFWPRKIYLEPNRLKQAASVLLSGHAEYWPHVRAGWHDGAMAHALRAFCDRHDAYLIVKSRQKSPIPRYLAAVADRCLYDESPYPATVLEALSIASLCISFYSSIVLDAVAMGVPHLCLSFSGEDYYRHSGRPPEYVQRFNLSFNTEEGGLYRFAGACAALSIPEAIERLPRWPLAPMDPQARARYVEQFLGFDDGRCAARVLDLIRQRVEAPVAPTAERG
jgi:hypothetical protein